jgi:autophagy-related protein 5
MDVEFAALKDAFQNSIKEAAYVRHNTSKVIMSMGKEDTTQLWESVEKGMQYQFTGREPV